MKSFTRPNVLLLYTDQQRKDSLGCYGNEKAITPNLDRLAAKGAKLNNFYVQASVCTPSRMSFLTGRYCSSLGVGTNGVSFTEVDAVPLHQLLKPYGYHTGQLGKLHFDPHAKRNHKDPAPDYGFDTFILSDEPGCYDDAYIKWVEKVSPKQVDKVRCKLPPAAYDYDKKSYSDVPRSTHKPYTFAGDEDLTHSSFVASQVCNYLENQENNEPFFAIAGFYAPHSPVNPPQRFVDMYDPEELSLPEIGEN
ncbi:MAG: sulfatase, partial [Bacillota bacterium]